MRIANGRVIRGDGIIENGYVSVEGDVIASVGKHASEVGATLDAEGGYILPGFIDLHVHGGGGFDFMDGDAKSILGVAKAHCKHGTTGLYATTMTCDDAYLMKMIEAYKEATKQNADGAALLGLHLEGPFFSQKGRGAQPVGEQRYPTREMLEATIAHGEGHIKRWDEAPELEGTDVFAKVMLENGIMPSIAHTSAVADEANRAFDLGFSHITHFYSATTTGQKIDGIVYSGVNEATFLRDDITVEVIADGRHIPKEHTLLAYKIKGADRMALITDAMRAAGTDQETSILGGRVGGVPVVIKNGVAQLPDLSSYAGSIGTMDRALRVVHLEYGIPLVDTVKMMSLTPAKIMGIDARKGSLEAGKDADIVIMDQQFRVRAVLVKGKLCYRT